jgi:isoleucyl-tRNA synthetase
MSAKASPGRAGYHPITAQVDLPAVERAILDLWRRTGTFAASLAARAEAPRWTFYEGPPTANGTPGVHHVEARVLKDVFCRFKTMQGFLVERKGGWDCHGLPVEIAVERELGFNGKLDIEAYGVAAFNARCRAAVMRNVDLFEDMTERMGYWVDTEHPYQTMDASYIESVWWALSRIHGQGLLVEDHRVAPYCPRCGTGLSDHELAQGYETVVDLSVYVRFPLLSGPYAGIDLLVWTTTPWTLVSNTAVAVKRDVGYVVATDGVDRLIVAEPLIGRALGRDWTVEVTLTGQDMEHWTYARPFELVSFPSPAHYVVLADYVTTDDGTGLVHQSPAFGEDDMAVAKAYDLPVVRPITTDGHFEREIPLVGGMFFKTADATLVADLQARGRLFKQLPYEHSYPHCWRCHTPLMYYAQPAWYVRTTMVKDALLRANRMTNWYPETIKEGRYGDWLSHNIDWSLSRSRYWGTPLPIWRNSDDPRDVVCVGSLAELSTLSGRDLAGLDPHRPAIDEVTFSRNGVAGTYRRVPEVIDAWFDSGSMPFAQWGYPHVAGSTDRFEQAFPAQYICEAIDQTRGWFYSLMAVSTLVFQQPSYENVLCLGLLLAEDGRKMSKHLGNIVLPVPLMDAHGADALRWFMACSGSPWQARRLGESVLQEIVRKVLLTYWNTVAFHVLYANSTGWSPSVAAPAVTDRPVLDRWLVSKTNELVRDVSKSLEEFDTQRAGTLLASFVDDLSNWYVRRSRRRFWVGDAAALATLHETLQILTRLLAPLTPFLTEQVWQDLVRPVEPGAPVSVHLAEWPVANESLVVPGLHVQVALARRITELGRAARGRAKVRTRQPLRRALVTSAGWARLGAELRAEICEELNIKRLESLTQDGTELVDFTAKGNFRTLGRKHGSRTPLVATAISEADAVILAAELRATGQASVQVAGEVVTVTADDVVISERPRAGWSVLNEEGETVALDLELDADLLRAGLAREAVRIIQEARKASGFEVTDRVALRWAAGGELAAALRAHATEIAAETLAASFEEVAELSGAEVRYDYDLDLHFCLAKV